MIKFAYGNGFHFIGRFRDLVEQLSLIEDKQMTLREYISSYRKRLN